MSTPLFYQSIADVVNQAREIGLTPKIEVDYRTVDADRHDPRPGISKARDPASYGQLAKWLLITTGIWITSALGGIQIAHTLNKLSEDKAVSSTAVQREVVGEVQPSPAAPVRMADRLAQLRAKQLKQVPPATQTSQADTPLPIVVDGTRLVPVSFNGKPIHSVHPEDRIKLAKEAAREAHLDQVLGWKESWKVVYGMISAESNWMPRQGMGNNGRASHGIAQMEGPTAKALGIDPHSPRRAAQGVVELIKEAVNAYKTRCRAGLKIIGNRGKPLPEKDALATYLSVHYNTTTKFRQSWDGQTSELLGPTQIHIKNVKYGMEEAALVERQVKAHKTFVDILRQRGTPVLDIELACKECEAISPKSAP